MFDFFTCRDLGSAGRWLEADHAVQCDDEIEPQTEAEQRYVKWWPFVVVAAFLYAIVVPAEFFWLVRKYKVHGLRGATHVQKALGWMCTF